MIVLLTGTNEVVPGVRRQRGVRRLSVHQVVNFGAGCGLTLWAVYSTEGARAHRRYNEALERLLPSLLTAVPRGVQLVKDGTAPS